MYTPFTAAGLFGLGAPEIGAIAILAVVLFGGKKFSELGKGLGEGIRGFTKAFKEGDETVTHVGKEATDAAKAAKA